VFYEVRITPLTDGREPDPFDEQMNRAFVDFTIDELVEADQGTDWPSATNSRHSDVKQLEAAVAARASALRKYVEVLLMHDQPLVGLVRDRRRERQLTSFTPQWIEFVATVRDGFTGTVDNYVNGIQHPRSD
jgi:hypothetical protein